MAETLASLVMSRRVLITVGAGGVGKTTTAAALGVAAAQRGRHVLCLTIDPARRLAEALGLQTMRTEEQRIEAAKFERAGLAMRGSLTAMMLDTKRTFDELVVKHSSSPERAQRLLHNKLYQYVSTSLAGTQEYMAMEKLVAVQADPRFDLVILDTPPTANALDFLDAPQKLADAIDSAAIKWFVQAFESSGKLSLNLLARSAAVILRGLGRVTGAGFLPMVAEFVTQLNELFGGFKERARRVEEALRSPDVSFVLVTSPAPMSIEEAIFFDERLKDSGMPRGAFVVNRFRLPPPWADSPPTPSDAAQAIAQHGLSLEDGAAARLVRAHTDAVRLSSLDALHVRALGERLNKGAAGTGAESVPVVRVPELPRDVNDLSNLSQLADTLMNGGV